MTVMQRMYEKGILCREKNGRKYMYEAKKEKISLLERIKNTIFNGNTIEMVSCLLQNDENIDQKDIEKMSKIIETYKEKQL